MLVYVEIVNLYLKKIIFSFKAKAKFMPAELVNAESGASRSQCRVTYFANISAKNETFSKTVFAW